MGMGGKRACNRHLVPEVVRYRLLEPSVVLRLLLDGARAEAHGHDSGMRSGELDSHSAQRDLISATEVFERVNPR